MLDADKAARALYSMGGFAKGSMLNVHIAVRSFRAAYAHSLPENVREELDRVISEIEDTAQRVENHFENLCQNVFD